MKFTNLHRLIILAAVLVTGGIFVACANSDAETGKAQSPTAAYEQLFKAVKSKNTPEIKKVMSKGTLAFAETAAGQYKKPIEEVLRNGFSQTTFADKLPAIRDERISGKFGAVEVYNKSESRWDDLPFVLEDGGWKLAVGDQFAGTFKSPGPSRTTRERINANAAGKGDLIPYGNGNLNTNVEPIIIDPTKGADSKGGQANPNAPK